MYLAPLLLGTTTGYIHAFLVLILSGSFLTALLALMISGVGATIVLLIAVAMRSEKAQPAERDRTCNHHDLQPTMH